MQFKGKFEKKKKKIIHDTHYILNKIWVLEEISLCQVYLCIKEFLFD